MIEQSNESVQDSNFKNYYEGVPFQQNSLQVELIIVRVAHQPFGLLMSQVYNIVRFDNGEVKLQQHPAPDEGREWGQIEYRGEPLKVLELARMLELPLVEPLQHSQILLSGRIHSSGLLMEPFGVACDEILVITSISTEDLRSIPGWLFQKRLGKLIWGAALLKQELLIEQYDLQGLMGGLLPTKSVLNHLKFPERAIPPALSPLVKPADGSLLHATRSNNDERRPVMLLDLEVLHARIYNS